MNTKNINWQTFSFYSSPISNTTPYKEFNLLDAYNYIVGHQAEHSTNTLRSITDKSCAKNYKANHFNYCTFSGVFSKRDDKSLIKHSGLLCIDFDHLDNLEETKIALLNDGYFDTLLLFVSPSGDGLKWVVSIDPMEASHENWFDAMSNYLLETYSLKADSQCRNVSRACFLPHDPNCFINPQIFKK